MTATVIAANIVKKWEIIMLNNLHKMYICRADESVMLKDSFYYPHYLEYRIIYSLSSFIHNGGISHFFSVFTTKTGWHFF